MGQSACSQHNDLQLESLNRKPCDQSEIVIDEQCDNPSKDILKNKFLQTQVIASWNILKQKPANLNKFEKIFHQIIDKNNLQTQNLKVSVSSNDQQNGIEQITESVTKALIKKKFLMKVPPAYENIQIDISTFIKIRTQNIYDFYEFKEKIGEGTFGNVYRGIEKRTGEIRAIKGLKKQMMNNVSKMSFIAEIDLLKKLDHPNIIKLYDLFLHEGVYYVVTEFCAGGNVQKYFSQQRQNINEDQTKIVMKQLFSALNYLYNCNIVHRDLKLQNLVFLKKPSKQGAQNLQIKLIDFGTAITVQKHKKNHSGLVGTLYYIAPEFTKGFFTQKCDIWSAGIIFYQLLFGDFPFKGRSQKQILQQIATKNIDWKKVQKKVSNQALQLLKNMLDKNYLTRASAKQLVQNDWIRDASVPRMNKEIRQSVSQSLANYNRKNNFVSLIQSFLAFKKITQIERQQLSRLFCEIDNDNSGIIDAEQLLTFYKTNFPGVNDKDIKIIVSNVDKNKSGKIDFNQFLIAVSKRNNLFAQEALREAFEYVDKDKTGFINRKEIKELLNSADKKEIDELFLNLDQNRDNQISFEEFKSYLINYQ